MTAKVYSTTIHSEDIFKKVVEEFERDANLSIIDTELSMEEMTMLFLNKLFQKKLETDELFKEYTLVMLENNIEQWRSEPDFKNNIEQFQITKHFITDKEVRNSIDNSRQSNTA